MATPRSRRTSLRAKTLTAPRQHEFELLIGSIRTRLSGYPLEAFAELFRRMQEIDRRYQLRPFNEDDR